MRDRVFVLLGSALTLPFVLVLSCDKPPPTPPSEDDAETPADVDESDADADAGQPSFLAGLQGDWRGPYVLTWMDQAKGEFSEETSDGTATVSGDRIEYTWEFRDEAQSGSIEVRAIEGGIETTLLDSWHTPDGAALVSQGQIVDGEIDVLATYAGDWGWRTKIQLEDPERLVVRMYNITPDGQEMIAVDLSCTRN